MLITFFLRNVYKKIQNHNLHRLESKGVKSNLILFYILLVNQ